MNCRQFEELVGAYVLWALPLPERMLADAHVRSCKRCRQLARDLQQTAQQLPLTVAPAAPRPHVRQRIMAAIKIEAAKEEALQAYPASRSDTVRKIADSPAAPYLLGDSAPASPEQMLPRPGEITPSRSGERAQAEQSTFARPLHGVPMYEASGRSKAGPLLVRKSKGGGWLQPGWRQLAIAAILLLSLSGGGLYWNWQLSQGSQLVVQNGQSAGTPEGSVASQGQGQHNGTELVMYSLHGLNADAALSGQATYDPQQRQIVLRAYHLPPLAGTQIYQGWLLHVPTPTRTSKQSVPGQAGNSAGPQTESVGVLVVQARGGQAELRFTVPGGDIHAYSAIAISREPGPYASPSAPRGPVVALGSLTPHS